MRLLLHALGTAAALTLVACGGGGGGDPGLVNSHTTPRPSSEDAGTPEADLDAGKLPAQTSDSLDAGPPKQPAEVVQTPKCDAHVCASLKTDACHIGECDAATDTCVGRPRDDGTPCGSASSGPCDDADSCSAGFCAKHHHATGSACGDQGVACHVNDTCDASGVCVDRGLAIAGTACGDATNTDCNGRDTCDAHGVCQANLAAEDQPCGATDAECRYGGRCDLTGNCIDRGYWTNGHCPPGHDHESGSGCSCGTVVETECQYTDVCVEGSCVPMYKPDSTTCNSAMGCCDGSGACGAINSSCM